MPTKEDMEKEQRSFPTKVFLVKSNGLKHHDLFANTHALEYNEIIELTPSELSQQFLSKELVLRKIDEKIRSEEMLQTKRGFTDERATFIAFLNLLKDEVLNECSATPENSALLKKLESL